jgi:C4-dicarboxylate-specific signal transduction histidine kinase
MPGADSSYCGRILNGPYSAKLKEHVVQCMRCFTAFENTGVPSIPYISAWHANDRKIWYEYAGRGLCMLFNCQPAQVAGRLRRSIVDRHNYRVEKKTPGVEKHSIAKAVLDENRRRLREEGSAAGFVDAVYKVALSQTKTVWLKDLATIETYPEDDLCLSLGALTIVTKEMRAEEERLARERLEVSLQMAGGVCHEMNQPLQILSGYAETLLQTLTPDDPNHAKAEKIMACILQMGEITGKLMRITRYKTKDYLQGIRIVDIDGAAGDEDE